jgi:predicted nucleic acid-binding protein
LVIQVLWDASALAKRYVAELRSQTVNALFLALPPAQMVTTIMSYSDTFAALLRKLNQGVLIGTAFTAAQAALRNEVIDDPDFVVLGLEFDDILDGIELIKRHNLNSTDGAILQAFLKRHSPMRPSVAGVLVASDRRLLRAAKAEGLEVLNPESVQAADIPAFLATLRSIKMAD